MDKQNSGGINWTNLLNEIVDSPIDTGDYEIFDPTTGITYKDTDELELLCHCQRKKITVGLWFCFGLCEKCVNESYREIGER